MMKSILTMGITSLVLLTNSAFGTSFDTQEKIFVNEDASSTLPKFTIETTYSKLGSVQKKFWSIQTAYEFLDPIGALQATATLRFLSHTPIFDVVDAEGNSIGSVEEKPHFFFPCFDIYSKDDALIARAKMNFWGTKYEILDPKTKTPIARLSRPFFRWKDTWTAEIIEPSYFHPNGIDSRLFITLIGFESDKAWMKQVKKTARSYYLSTEEQEETALDLSHFQNLLDQVRSLVEGTVPTEEDVAFVSNLLNNYIQTLDPSEASSPQEILERSFDKIVPLFQSERLTLGQKSALYLILEQFLAQLKEAQEG